MTLPNLSPQLGEPSKQGWLRLAENLQALHDVYPGEEAVVWDDLAELIRRCEVLASESYPCDLSVLERRKKQGRLERELAEVS